MSQQSKLTTTQRFWRLLKPDRKEITNVYVYSIFNGLINLSLPLGIQAIINLIQGGRVSTSWIILVMFVVLGVAITGVLQIYQLRITENLQQKIFSRSAFEFAYRIPKIRMEALYRHYAPELMNRFFDTISVQKGLSKILIDFSSAALQVTFGLILLSLYHPFFILFGLVLVMLVYAIFRFTGKRGLQTSLEESKFKYKVAHWLEELARTHTTFKLAGKSDLPLQHTDKHVGDYLQARESHFKVLVQQYSLMVVFKVLVATGLLAIGGILVMNQQMNIGQFVAAEIIILMVMASVEKLILSLETIYDVLTSLEKIGQVTDLELEATHGTDLGLHSQNAGLEVQMDTVSFTYPGAQKKTLNEFSIHIREGEKWLISGPNGSGKSTLLFVLAGLYRVQEGSLMYNGISKASLHPDSLRSVIGDCLSQELLFEGTLLDNIAMGKEEVTFDDVKWAVRHLRLEKFISSLPEGYDTMLDPQGKRFPRSVIQKLLLARAIADKPKLLLLEDVFEHIEETERREIFDFLTSSENAWTMVAVSSDPYIASRCDTIGLIQDGQMIRTGTYDEMKSIVNFKTKGHA